MITHSCPKSKVDNQDINRTKSQSPKNKNINSVKFQTEIQFYH